MKYTDDQANKVISHLALQHAASPVRGCAWCEDDEELGETIEQDLGMLDE